MNLSWRMMKDFKLYVSFCIMKKQRITPQYLATNISIVIGLVLIWRGVWYVLDELDKLLLGGHHLWTAFLGIVIGLIILYVPDKDLKEIEKL